MGHRLLPVTQKIGDGLYVNLGDWITHQTYGLLEDGEMTLQTWSDRS